MVALQRGTKPVNGTHWQARPARTRRRGAAVVELAITVPLLSFLALGVVEYAQLTHAAQVVSNASRRGARYAARNETTSTASVESYVRDFITGSFENLTTSEGLSAVTVSVLDGAGASIANGDLSTTSSGTPLVVDVSFEFESIRVMDYFGVLDNKTLQTSATARRE